jgi:Mn-dependent DtxR family transcriptional regulator
MGDWTFFSNHGHVLVCLAQNHEARLRDVAQDVGITERAVQKIVRDLQDAGMISIRKQGRCNRYRINRRKSLRHSLESHVTVGKLLTLITTASRKAKSAEAVESEALAEVTQNSPIPEDLETQNSEPLAKNAKSSPKKAAESGAKSEEGKKAESADTRQQGSLF